MNVPSDIAHKQLVAMLQRHGYVLKRQSGSHIRMTHPGPPQHHLSVPAHRIVRQGTLHSIISQASKHLGITFEALVDDL